jgi:hypothetical protein
MNTIRSFPFVASLLISFALVTPEQARAESKGKAVMPDGKPVTSASSQAIAPTAISVHEEPAAPTSVGRDSRIPVMATLGYGSDDLSIGIGVRAGKMLTDRIYVGGTFVYHLGHDVASSQVGGYTSKASLSAFYIGPEVGYDFQLAPVTVRAYSGLGIIWLNASATTSGPGAPAVSADSSTNKFVIWPGASVFYPLPGSSFFIGGDLHFVTIPGGPASEICALAGTLF